MAMPYMAKPYMAKPYMAKPYMAKPYGNAIWQCHMAAAAAAALRCNGRPETFFRNFTLEKVTSKIGKVLKKLVSNPLLKSSRSFFSSQFRLFSMFNKFTKYCKRWQSQIHIFTKTISYHNLLNPLPPPLFWGISIFFYFWRFSYHRLRWGLQSMSEKCLKMHDTCPEHD